MKLFFLVENKAVKAHWTRIANSMGADIDHDADIALQPDCIGLVHLSSVSKEKVEHARQRFPSIKWVAFSDIPSDAEGLLLLEQGFCGYLNTYPTSSVFAEVLAVVLRHDIWAGPSLTQKLLKQFLQQHVGSPKEIISPREYYQLTERESEVLDLLLVGCSNKEIARELNRTERTVKSHVTAILKKTETKDRLALILKLNKHTD